MRTQSFRDGQSWGRAWRWRLVVVAVAMLGVGLRAASLNPFAIGHPDELSQYLEQANRLATGHGLIPWEVRYGVRNQLIPQLLAGPMWLGHWLAPGTFTAVWFARAAYAALCGGATLLAAWRLGALQSRFAALAALAVAAVWWQSVLYDDLLLSESLSAGLMLLASAALLRDADAGDARRLRMAGMVLGLAVVVRFQNGLFAAVLTVAALRLDLRRWRPLLIGGLVAGMIGAASDVLAGHVPFGWVLTNLAMNVGVQGRAAKFGVEPWWHYAALLFSDFGVALPFVLVGALASGKRWRPLLLAAVVHIVAHSLLAHKEPRFVWISELTVLLLAVIASVRLAEAALAQPARRAVSPVLLGALLVVAWLVADRAALMSSGGAGARRGGAAIPHMAGLAAARGPTCGIAVPDQWRAHVVPALLPRVVPLYVAPAGVMAGRQALPADLAAAADALVFPALPAGAGAYRLAGCGALPRSPVCLYVRPGRCVPAAAWSYQAALGREDL